MFYKMGFKPLRLVVSREFNPPPNYQQQTKGNDFSQTILLCTKDLQNVQRNTTIPPLHASTDALHTCKN